LFRVPVGGNWTLFEVGITPPVQILSQYGPGPLRDCGMAAGGLPTAVQGFLATYRLAEDIVKRGGQRQRRPGPKQQKVTFRHAGR